MATPTPPAATVSSPDAEAASRLCTACGLCCSGVLFHVVKLQPADSVPALAACGLTINRKKTAPYFHQPCPQLQQGHCQIYLQRPQRCRLFECRQLHLLAAGQTTETAALDHIRQAQSQVTAIESLLADDDSPPLPAPSQRPLPLAERCQQAPASSPAHAALQNLERYLNRHFRPSPSGES